MVLPLSCIAGNSHPTTTGTGRLARHSGPYYSALHKSLLSLLFAQQCSAHTHVAYKINIRQSYLIYGFYTDYFSVHYFLLDTIALNTSLIFDITQFDQDELKQSMSIK